jgi:hypothetical protein
LGDKLEDSCPEILAPIDWNESPAHLDQVRQAVTDRAVDLARPGTSYSLTSSTFKVAQHNITCKLEYPGFTSYEGPAWTELNQSPYLRVYVPRIALTRLGPQPIVNSRCEISFTRLPGEYVPEYERMPGAEHGDETRIGSSSRSQSHTRFSGGPSIQTLDVGGLEALYSIPREVEGERRDQFWSGILVGLAAAALLEAIHLLPWSTLDEVKRGQSGLTVHSARIADSKRRQARRRIGRTIRVRRRR